ncbi:MAG: hypothetical protein IE933_13930 [Sphingomonadales bacterium]|nr:hypothetical protein [Sphingomonadales bacterium]MBD3774286.1 hypothetical protein [Paracoccaceae bacterium]
MDTLRGNFGSGDYADDHRDYDPSEDEPVRESPPPGIGQDERRMQVRAYNHWASLLADRNFPSIEDLDAQGLPDFGPYSVVLDFTAGIENPAIQFLGTKLAAECGAGDDIETLDDVPSRSLLSRITDHYMQILANQAPIGFEAEFVNQRGATILYRGILLPFSSDDETIDFIYGVINWKEMADQLTADELLLEIDQALEADEDAAADAGDPALDLVDEIEDADEPQLREPDPVTDWAEGPANDILDLPLAEDEDDDDYDFALTPGLPEPRFGLSPMSAEDMGEEEEDWDEEDDAAFAPLILDSEYVPDLGDEDEDSDDWDNEGEPLDLADALELGDPAPVGDFAAAIEEQEPVEALDLGAMAVGEDEEEVEAEAPVLATPAVTVTHKTPVLVSVDPVEPAIVAEVEDFSTFAAEETASEELGLYDCLAAAREMALAARSSEDRTRVALYEAVGRAYDFSIAAQDSPEDFEELVAENGLTTQDRAPMTPVVKLVFGADYDKTRLTEYAAVLTHGHRLGVARGQLADYLRQAEGGLKGVVAAERRLRREEAGKEVEPVDGPRAALARKLRKLEPVDIEDLSADGPEFGLVMIRRLPTGEVVLLGEVPEDIALLERAARKLIA